MKKLLLIPAILLYAAGAYAQFSTNITFSNYLSATDHDLVNLFSPVTGFYQVGHSGVSGGSVGIPYNGGSATFKKILSQPTAIAPIHVRMLFKYSADSLDNYDDMISVALLPGRAGQTFDVNSRIRVYVRGESTSARMGHEYGVGDTTTFYVPQLIHNRWYQWDIKLLRTNNQNTMEMTVTLHDMGLQGTSVTSLLKTYNTTLLAPGFYGEEDVQLQLEATLSAGARWVDNVLIEGIYSLDVTDVGGNRAKASVYPTEVRDEVTIAVPEYSTKDHASATVYDMSGRPVRRHEITSGKDKMNLGDLSAGMYMMRVMMNGQQMSTKIMKL